MVKTSILTICLFFYFHSVFATDIYQWGKIILNNGDTINCEIEVYEPFVFINYDKIKYRIHNQPFKVSLKEVNEFYLDTLQYQKISNTYLYTLQEGPRNVTKKIKEDAFAAVFISGNYKLLELYKLSAPYGGGPIYLVEDYYVQAGGEFNKISFWTFKKDCLNIFKNCKRVSEKIANSEFSYRDIKSLVIFANNSCSNIP